MNTTIYSVYYLAPLWLMYSHSIDGLTPFTPTWYIIYLQKISPKIFLKNIFNETSLCDSRKFSRWKLEIRNRHQITQKNFLAVAASWIPPSKYQQSQLESNSVKGSNNFVRSTRRSYFDKKVLLNLSLTHEKLTASRRRFSIFSHQITSTCFE